MVDEHGGVHFESRPPPGTQDRHSLSSEADHHSVGKKGSGKGGKQPACMANAVQLQWEIKNFSKLQSDDPSKNCHTTETQSDEKEHQWRLKLYPNGTKADGNLSLFLDTPDLPFGWERTVCFALTLVNYADDSKSVQKNVHRHIFKSQKNDLCNWGWSSFVNASRVFREGFLKDDTMVVKAAITVENTSTKMDPSEVDVYLSYAAESGCVESVMTCLAQGACVNSESEDQFTPLHYASFHGHVAVAQSPPPSPTSGKGAAQFSYSVTVFGCRGCGWCSARSGNSCNLISCHSRSPDVLRLHVRGCS